MITLQDCIDIWNFESEGKGKWEDLACEEKLRWVIRTLNNKRKCEWNPEVEEPAHWNEKGEYVGCGKRAEVVVGKNGQWHLCKDCSQKPKFRRFKKIYLIKEKGAFPNA